VLVCFGTRPEAIKLAPVISQLEQDERLSSITVTTSQHREMLQQVLTTFDIRPEIDLSLMRERQQLSSLTARAVSALGETIGDIRPNAVLVQGDTTTAFCAALAAFYHGVPVGHVEAGLRTHNTRDPFPEEINRRLISTVAEWHFCPTERNSAALAAEGIPRDRLLVTGNTVIDALLMISNRPLAPAEAHPIPSKGTFRRILVTLHRRETQGETQRRLAAMLRRVADRPDVQVLFPVHLSPAVRESVVAELDSHPKVHLIDPLEYTQFVHAMKTSDLVVTDSGGVQEEAPTFGIPVIVMRETTERREGVDAGCVLLSGTDHDAVERDIVRLLDDSTEYDRMARATNPYGDGHAAERVVARLRRDLADPESREEPLPFAAHRAKASARR